MSALSTASDPNLLANTGQDYDPNFDAPQFPPGPLSKKKDKLSSGAQFSPGMFIRGGQGTMAARGVDNAGMQGGSQPTLADAAKMAALFG